MDNFPKKLKEECPKVLTSKYYQDGLKRLI